MAESGLRKLERNHPTCSPVAEDVRLGLLANIVSFHLRRAQSASSQAFARQLDHMDVSPSWFAVLALIGENPGITQTALSRANRKNSPGRRPACSSGPICRLLKGVWHGLADAGSE